MRKEKHSTNLNRLLSLFSFWILFLFCLSNLAIALNSEYKIDDLRLTMHLPDDFVAGTRTIAPNEALLSHLQMKSVEEFNEYLEANKAYLTASNLSDMTIVLVSMEDKDHTSANFNLINDDSIKDIAATFFKNTNYTTKSIELISNPQIKFAELSCENSIDDVRSIFYVTIYNSKAACLLFSTKQPEISPSQKEVMREIVRNIHFDVLYDAKHYSAYKLGEISASVSMVIIVGIVILIYQRRKKKNRNNPAPPPIR